VFAAKAVTIPFSAAYFAINAFCSPGIFKYKEHFPVAANTSRLASQIKETAGMYLSTQWTIFIRQILAG